MKNSQKQLVKDTINKRIRRLNIILDNNTDADFKQDDSDELERMDSLNRAEVDNVLLAAADQELNRLKANLEWMEQEEGGNCVECDDEIPVRRLLAVPTTRHCIKCEKVK